MIEALASFDQEIFLTLNSWNAEWLNPVMIWFSKEIIWVPFVAFILSLAYRQLGQKSFFIFLLFLCLTVVASDTTSSYLLKNIFKRLRPCKVEELKHAMNVFGQKCGGRFGFVSSHAANSISILAFSFLALKIKNPKIYWLWLLPLIVGYSRIYLGVHFPGDVLGGIMVGGLWGATLALFFKSHESWGKST